MRKRISTTILESAIIDVPEFECILRKLNQQEDVCEYFGEKQYNRNRCDEMHCPKCRIT